MAVVKGTIKKAAEGLKFKLKLNHIEFRGVANVMCEEETHTVGPNNLNLKYIACVTFGAEYLHVSFGMWPQDDISHKYKSPEEAGQLKAQWEKLKELSRSLGEV